MPAQSPKNPKRTKFQFRLPPYGLVNYRPGLNTPDGSWDVQDLMALHMESIAQIDEESLDCLIEAARIEKNEREINGRKRRGRISRRKWEPLPQPFVVNADASTN